MFESELFSTDANALTVLEAEDTDLSDDDWKVNGVGVIVWLVELNGDEV